jgi:GNAT superfamily N-acetyltransferase
MKLVFRAARASDKPRVLEFTAHTWGEDEGDYIKDVFDDWLADPKGQFVAAELDGQPVAIGKLTDLGDGELWLEGLRVDPEHRRQGIGAALHSYHVDLARRLGGRVLRYATGQNNSVSQNFGVRTGFQLLSSYRWHAAEATTDFPPPDRLSASDLPELQRWLDSPLLHSAHGLYPRVWKLSRLSEQRLQAHFESGQVFGLRGQAGLRGWAICCLEPGWDAVELNHFDAIDSLALADMARAMRRYGADVGLPKIEMLALDPSPLIDALRETGFHADDSTLVILELWLETRDVNREA